MLGAAAGRHDAQVSGPEAVEGRAKHWRTETGSEGTGEQGKELE